MKVLVVDDSEYARKRIGKILCGAGHEVVEAENAEDALKVIGKTKPDVATVDLLMPGMHGIELVRRLRALLPELPIIVLSADVQLATRREALAAGATRFVAKTEIDEVLSAVNQARSAGLTPLILPASEKDAFTEIMNIAMGKAAEALSVLLKRRVYLKVPEIELMTSSTLIKFFEEELVQVGAVIRQRFSGRLNGSASMVFSSAHASFLVRTLSGIQQELSRLSSAEQSVLTEMGNIVLNSAIAVIADECGERLKVSLPRISLNQGGGVAALELIDTVAGADSALVLVSRLTIVDAEIISYLILLMPEENIKRFLMNILK